MAPFALCSGERDPRGHDFGLVETPVVESWCHDHEGRVARFLDEEVGGPAEEVRHHRGLDRVDDVVVRTRSASHEKSRATVAQVALERPAGLLLELLEACANLGRVGFRQRGWGHAAVAPELVRFGVG